MAKIDKLAGCSIREISGVGSWGDRSQGMFKYLADKLFTVIPYERNEATGELQFSYMSRERLKEVRQRFEFQPFIIFSDFELSKEVGGGALAKLITEKKLGTLHVTSPRTNWTGRKIVAYLWEVDYAALAKYITEELGTTIGPLSPEGMAALEPPKVATPPARPTPAAMAPAGETVRPF